MIKTKNVGFSRIDSKNPSLEEFINQVGYENVVSIIPCCGGSGEMYYTVLYRDFEMQLNEEQKFQIYEEIKFNYAVQDAESQVADYIEKNKVNETLQDILTDMPVYLKLAEQYQEHHDSSIAENDLWQELIDDYANSFDVHKKKGGNSK